MLLIIRYQKIVHCFLKLNMEEINKFLKKKIKDIDKKVPNANSLASKNALNTTITQTEYNIANSSDLLANTKLNTKAVVLEIKIANIVVQLLLLPLSYKE